MRYVLRCVRFSYVLYWFVKVLSDLFRAGPAWALSCLAGIVGLIKFLLGVACVLDCSYKVL